MGTIVYWDLEPLASSWGVHAAGLWKLRIAEDGECSALATFLLGESLRELQSAGVTLAELQVVDGDKGLGDAGNKLGFRVVDEAIRFEKTS